MSYILEALKKSDRERKQGKVPDLETVQDPVFGRNRRQRPLWPYVLLGFLALCSILFGAWMLWRQPLPVPQPEAETAAIDDQSQAVESSPGSGSAAPATPSEPGGPESDTALSPNAGPVNLGVNNPRQPETEPAPPPTASPPPASPAAAATGLESAPPDNVVEIVPADEPEETQPTEEKVAAKIVKLENLPAELQEELPEIKIGIHLYSDNQASRRAGINGRLLHEGQLVVPGLRLEEITRQGAILSFRGRKFSVAVFPR